MTMAEPDGPGATPVIEFKDVSMGFDEKRALDDVSFRLDSNQMIIITGRSNSGKSVLLHLAIGLLRPTEGQILVEGCPVHTMSESELLQLRSADMGIAFQEDTLFTGLSVFENTAYRLYEHDWPEPEVQSAVHEILRFVGLEADIEKLPEELSIGMRRRLEIARALVGWPKIMLFDEPATGLDPINNKMIMDLVIRARDLHSISILMVTKELHEIRYLSTHHAVEDEPGAVRIVEGVPTTGPRAKVMVLEEGKIVFAGALAEFESSDLPAVRVITHSDADQPTSHTPLADPWASSNKRRQRPD
ncbi:MAG TPA: ATP-binding cassette domain-containing protein [Blastocatellia bacterium]|nr:ATP-binding cassette domain-containing protein [Blastocatellia bacterium]